MTRMEKLVGNQIRGIVQETITASLEAQREALSTSLTDAVHRSLSGVLVEIKSSPEAKPSKIIPTRPVDDEDGIDL